MVDDSDSVISVESSVKHVEGAHDLKSLQSVYLNDNKIFMELKVHLEKYHNDRLSSKPKLHPLYSTEWKKVLYTSLEKMLQECVFTKNAPLQQQLLEKTHKWYYDKVGWPEPKPAVVKHPTLENVFPEPSSDTLNKYKRKMIAAQTIPKRPSTAPTYTVGAKLGPAGVQGRVGLPVAQRPDATYENTNMFYKPFEAEGDIEQKIEERYMQVKIKELADKRVAEEMRSKIQAWTESRSRQEEELIRRTEGFKYASRFEARGYTYNRPNTAGPGPMKVDCTEDVLPPIIQEEEGEVPNFDAETPLEQVGPPPNDRISRIRQLHEALIPTEDQELEHDASLSAYARQNSANWSRPATGIRPTTANSYNKAARPPTGLSMGQRPTTAATYHSQVSQLPRSETAGRVEQMQEIETVKRQMAKFLMPCSVTSVTQALLAPEELTEEQQHKFPRPGSALIVNPFAKTGKKKKKGKGKKKRGKKRR